MKSSSTPTDKSGDDALPESHSSGADEIQFASAFVTPFAAAVAVELEEFGLSKHKIDEIMLRSAERFGAMNGDGALNLKGHESHANNATGSTVGWLSGAAEQAYGVLALVGKHVPHLIDTLAPIVTDALKKAVADYLSGASASRNKTKAKAKVKS